MRARMESIDRAEHRRVDRRTFIKTGLIAGGALAGAGLGIRAAADGSGEGTSQPRAAPA